MHETKYSLTTSQPLKAFGCLITPEQIAFFAQHKLWALVDEFASLKSDGIKGRAGRNEELSSSAPGHVLADAHTAPLSLHIVRCWLSQLGLQVTFQSQNNHVALELSRLTADRIRQMSSGLIKKADTLHHRSGAAIDDGLLCPKIYSDDQAELFNWAHIELGATVFADMWLQLPGETSVERCEWDWDVVPVIPLALRPLVQLDNGNFATHDINDLYRTLINQTNRYRKLIELKAPESILTADQRELQRELTHTQANRYFSKRQAKLSEGRRLTSAVDMVLKDLLEPYKKRVEWCAVAKAVSVDEMSTEKTVVSAEMFERLRLSEELPVLICRPESARWCAALPIRGAEGPIEVSSELAARLGIVDTADVELHRPVTVSGQCEASQLMRMEAMPESIPLPTNIQIEGWQPEDGERKFLQRLVALARDGGSISLQSGVGYLLAGSGRCLDFD